VASLDINMEPINGEAIIRVRPNVHIKCGDEGLSSGTCNVYGGDVQVDATDLMGETLPATNVTFEGVTFMQTKKYSIWGNKQGNITFIDCHFKGNREAEAPVLADYYKPSDENSMLEMTFIDCLFDNNRYFGKPAYPALITSNGIQNKIVVANSFFTNNDMIFNNTDADKISFLIESSGPLELYDNCFQDNKVGVANAASYSEDTPISVRNFGEGSSGGACNYLASFETDRQYELFQPRCLVFESNFCTALVTPSPSTTPSAAPTPVGSGSPTVSAAPSATPTISAMPSATPTAAPSASPSSRPSISPAPSASPTALPSGNPTITPVPTPSPSVSSKPSASPTLPVTESPTIFPESEASGDNNSGSVSVKSVNAILVAVGVVSVMWMNKM